MLLYWNSRSVAWKWRITWKPRDRAKNRSFTSLLTFNLWRYSQCVSTMGMQAEKYLVTGRNWTKDLWNDRAMMYQLSYAVWLIRVFCSWGWGLWCGHQFDRVYTAKNATGLLQVVNFTNLLQLVNKLQQACQFYQVATSLLKSGLLQFVICWNNLLKQLAESLLITSLDNQFATSLLTTCDRLVLNKLSQAMRTHPDIGLCNKLLQDVKRLVATFVGVWLCRSLGLGSKTGTFVRGK